MSRTSLDLTRRQFDVMVLIIEGKTNAQIAEELDVTMGTVKTHLTGIFDKLGVSNRTGAALAALEKYPMLRVLAS